VTGIRRQAPPHYLDAAPGSLEPLKEYARSEDEQTRDAKSRIVEPGRCDDPVDLGSAHPWCCAAAIAITAEFRQAISLVRLVGLVFRWAHAVVCTAFRQRCDETQRLVDASDLS